MRKWSKDSHKTSSSSSSISSSSSSKPHHVGTNGKLQFRNPWQTVEESEHVDDGSINQQAQNASASGTPTTSSAGWMAKLSSVMPTIPIEWAKELTGHAQRQVKVITPYFVNAKSEMNLAKHSESNIKATWLGHACFLVEMPSGQRLLFDPIFSDRAGPSAWTGIRRRLPPPCKAQDLPPIDVVLITHNHYDHLDLPTIQGIFRNRGKDVLFAVPLGLASWLTSSGIPPNQIHEFDWWEELVLPCANISEEGNSLKITSTPAQHTSGRSVIDRNTTLWCSWVVQQTTRNEEGGIISTSIYHAGDTGYSTPRGPCPFFKEIGARLGPFDLAMIPIWRGGTLGFVSQMGLRLTHHPLLSALHCTPIEAVRGIHSDVRARHSLACHFATFAGSDTEALEPLVELERAKRAGATWDGKGNHGLAVREMEMATTTKRKTGSDSAAEFEARGGLRKETEAIGDWMEEGGFGWIDVGATAEIPSRITGPQDGACLDHT